MDSEPEKGWKEECEEVLGVLMSDPVAWPFLQPVDPVALGIPDYFAIIRRPMDLGTVKKKLATGNYKDTDEFAADVRLVFSNCLTYNMPSSDISQMATALSSTFENLLGPRRTD